MTKSLISDPCKYLIGESGAYYNPKYFEVIEGRIFLKNTKDPKTLDVLVKFKEK